MGGGGFRPMSGGFEGNYLASRLPPPLLPPQQQADAGQKRGFPFPGRDGSPNRDRSSGGGSSFAKLFVGSVPRTATEMDIRPLFEKHGNVLEVALIRDKRTGQQQGCCFIKYATIAEADRAIRALHNQHTLPGGMGPIQVRYADGERERLGAVEYKLFVGSLNKQATEKEVEEIFSQFGRVEDVYLMRDELKQSRGCGFVKYSDKDTALAAIGALHGVYTMRGCDQPLTVRFADPKRPRSGTGDSRVVAPALGGPGFGPRFQAPGPRPGANFGDPMGDHVPSNAWQPMSPQNMGPSSNPGISYAGHRLPKSTDLAMPLNTNGRTGGPSDGSFSGVAVSPSSASQLGFSQSSLLVPSAGHQTSPVQKPLQSPQQLPTSQLHPRAPPPYTQTQNMYPGQIQNPLPSGQAFPQPHAVGLMGQMLPQLQQGALPAPVQQTQLSINLQPNTVTTITAQQQLPAPTQQKPLHPLPQSPSQLAQMLSQQTQTLQASFQSSQQAFSQLQQQLQSMQPSNQSLTSQQNLQPSQEQQPQQSGIAPQMVSSTAPTPVTDASSAFSGAVAPVTTQGVPSRECPWTEHTSPDGFKYYHNSQTRESRWDKPEDLVLFEQQQRQQQKPLIQQPQLLTNPPQVQQVQLQSHFHHPQQLQPSYFPSSYQAFGVRAPHNHQEFGYTQLSMTNPSMNDPTRFQQPMQESAWKNKASGT